MDGRRQQETSLHKAIGGDADKNILVSCVEPSRFCTVHVNIPSRTVLNESVKRELNGYPSVKDNHFTTRS